MFNFDVRRRKKTISVQLPGSEQNGPGGGGSGGGVGGAGGAGGFMPIGDVTPTEDVGPAEDIQDPNNPNSPQFWERLQQVGDQVEAQLSGKVGDVQGAQNKGLMDPSITAGASDGRTDISGGSVATYGWKMYEDEEQWWHAQDVQDLLQKIREASQVNPSATSEFLNERPHLSDALFAAAGSAGNDVGITGTASIESATAPSYGGPGGWG